MVTNELMIWGNALADQLSERIHVVGINRHDVSVGMGVKIADRQRIPYAGTAGCGRLRHGSWLTLTIIQL